jgi:hypothetical protein
LAATGGGKPATQRLQRHLLAERWRKYDLAHRAAACGILPEPRYSRR